MKKSLLLLLAITTSLYALATEYHSLEEIRDQWTTRNIKVPQEGNNPGIVQLLKAFQDTWHVYTISPVLEKAKNPNFTFEADEECGGGITVDRKNGFVSLDSGGSDSGYMEACAFPDQVKDARILLASRLEDLPKGIYVVEDNETQSFSLWTGR